MVSNVKPKNKVQKILKNNLEKSVKSIDEEKKSLTSTNKKKRILKVGDLSWIDSTVYRCETCQKAITGRKEVKGHFKKHHRPLNPFPNGIRKDPHQSLKIIESQKLYYCKIEGCNHSIRRFYDNINQHMTHLHKMNMVEYHYKYEAKKTKRD